MRKIILEYPGQFKVGLKAAEKVKITRRRRVRLGQKNLIFCGMGGSALAPELLKIWLQENKINLPLKIHRDYGLPCYAKDDDLIICISYSGNTEETLNCFEEALEKKSELAAISAGGRIRELCQKNKIPFVQLPSGFQPRMTLGFQFAALARILANSGLIASSLIEEISDLESRLQPLGLEETGKKLADSLKNKIPVIYASKRLRALARIWKIKFNENSKMPAFSNFFPELNHNEMVGFTSAGENIHTLILKDAADNPKILKRMALTEKIIQKKGLHVDTIEIKGYDILDKLFSNILLADWASYYLALEQGIDPTPVEIVEEFKKNLYL